MLYANRNYSALNSIFKGYLAFAEDDKPLPRAAKCTDRHFAAIKFYSQEFKDLYFYFRSGRFISNPRSVTKQMLKSSSEMGAEAEQFTTGVSIDTKSSLTSAIDTRIEKVLKDLMAGLFLQHLRPPFCCMTIEMLQSTISSDQIGYQNQAREHLGCDADQPRSEWYS